MTRFGISHKLLPPDISCGKLTKKSFLFSLLFAFFLLVVYKCWFDWIRSGIKLVNMQCLTTIWNSFRSWKNESILGATFFSKFAQAFFFSDTQNVSELQFKPAVFSRMQISKISNVSLCNLFKSSRYAKFTGFCIVDVVKSIFFYILIVFFIYTPTIKWPLLPHLLCIYLSSQPEAGSQQLSSGRRGLFWQEGDLFVRLLYTGRSWYHRRTCWSM